MSITSQTYRLLRPFLFAETSVPVEPRQGQVLVRPTLASVCQADLRYFLGRRRQEALKLKLPMALLHEGIGTVVDDPTGTLHAGERVVIVPNIPGYIHSPDRYQAPENCCSGCASGGPGANYCQHVKFLGSGIDGIAQSLLAHPAACLVRIPDAVPDSVAVLAELMSVCVSTWKRVGNDTSKRVAIIGDGVIGYLMAVALVYGQGLPPEQLQVIGISKKKLAKFDFANTVNQTEQVATDEADIIFDCVGGDNSRESLELAIKRASRGGKIALMGVSEDYIPINTRDVLEKGLTLIGNSRSAHTAYPEVLKIMEQPAVQERLTPLITRTFRCTSLEDYTAVFTYLADQPQWSKVAIEFSWNNN